MNLSERINNTNAAPWVIEEIKRMVRSFETLVMEPDELYSEHLY